MSKLNFTSFGCLLLATSTLCNAQESHLQERYNFDPPSATFGPNFYGHASTFHQGILDGAANYVGALGQAHYYHRMAQLAGQRARLAQMQNNLIAVKGHYAKQAIRREFYAQQREQNRLRNEQRRARRAELAASSTNRLIEWPLALKRGHFTKNRFEVESLLKLKSQLGPSADGSVTADLRRGIVQLAEKVVKHEKTGRLNVEQSKVVRQFVRNLYRDALEPAQPSAELVAMH